jgi:hypothetical protein
MHPMLRGASLRLTAPRIRHLMEIKLRKGRIERLPAGVFKIEHGAPVSSRFLLIWINDAGKELSIF